jgi:hypothetical protein
MAKPYARCGEVASDVAAAVVAHHCLDGDGVIREPLDRSFQEPDRGVRAFVVEDLDVRDAAVVIDCDVDELPALTTLPSPARDATTGDAMPRPHETTEFLRSRCTNSPGRRRT